MRTCPYYIDDIDCTYVMDTWDIETYNGNPAIVQYINYLTSIRDFNYWQTLDRLCGYDVTTAIKIAEMQ